MSSNAVKSTVAAMMQLPKAERVARLVAMAQECIKREEDAAPFLELIQMELNSPDDSRPASRPSTTASSVARAAAPPAAAPAGPPQEKPKSKRRQLVEQRNELRAMLAKVDRAMGGGDAGAAPVKPKVEDVPEAIKARFREEYDQDPVAFAEGWAKETPEFRRQALQLYSTKPPTP